MDRRFHYVSVVLSVVLSVPALAKGRGFEDPVLLDKVMKGNIVVEQVMATKTEFKSSVRAFFKGVSPEAYTDLFTSHKKWIGLLPEIKDAKTNSASADKTEYTYWMHMKVKYAIFTFDIYPEGKQTIAAGKDAVSEWAIKNEITNYKDDLKLAEENLRLIPHQGGILVEDNIHVILAKESSQATTAKKEIEKKWVALMGAFRDELGGN
jgi:hypothetical protein